MLTHGTKVLITGGAGFIGSHVARALSASGCTVRVLDDLSTGRRERIAALDGIEFLQADVRNPAAVHRAMADVKAVIHLAGVQPGVDPIRAQEVNLGGALHILNFARDVDKRAAPARRPVRLGVGLRQADRVRPPRGAAAASGHAGGGHGARHGAVRPRLSRSLRCAGRQPAHLPLLRPRRGCRPPRLGHRRALHQGRARGQVAGHLRRRPADARPRLRRQRRRRHPRRARGSGSAGRAAQHRLGRSGRHQLPVEPRPRVLRQEAAGHRPDLRAGAAVGSQAHAPANRARLQGPRLGARRSACAKGSRAPSSTTARSATPIPTPGSRRRTSRSRRRRS